MKNKKGKLNTVLLVIALIAGLSLLLYPTVANYWNSLHQTKAISAYTAAVANISEDEYEIYWQEAEEYNKNILRRANLFSPTEEEKQIYLKTLNLTGDGVMGYIEIPSIEVLLPVYHSTSDSVLQVATGHLDWTSLPVGGESTHCVISGHRGLPSAKLFTNLDRLAEGDVFMLRVLNEVLTYEVDRILIVEPQSIQPLEIEPGWDYCTLVTCTPYGINTHRMLVRGHRIENAAAAVSVFVTPDAVQIDPTIISAVAGIPTLVIMLIVSLITEGARQRRRKRRYGE